MIPNLQLASGAPQALSLQPSAFSLVPVQPIHNVRQYLTTRHPVRLCQDEELLLITLPECDDNRLRSETRALCAACAMVLARVRAKPPQSVQAACKAVLALFPGRGWKLGTFRQKYDWWAQAKDWTVLVNCSRAGADWIDRDFGLADKFLDFCSARIGEFKRKDAGREALRSIRRQWETGLNHLGVAEVIGGYEAAWENRNRQRVPEGWTVGNLDRQIKARARLRAAEKAMLHEGIAAARKFLPQVRSSREGLRFMEEVQFDDVKCDFRVFDTATGKPVDLWLLVAHDRATAMLLGFGMRPATVREDGSQTHLKLRDTKQLCGWVLERYGLPPYPMTWKMERGTATLDDGTTGAIEELLLGRLNVSFSMMIRGSSPSGYLEAALGNSKGKASLESHNRIGHMIGAGMPGQTGPAYGVRPRDLIEREKECELIFNAAQEFPAGLRERLIAEFGYPLLTLQQARRALVNIFTIRNARSDHNLEGFEQVLENRGGKLIQRMESPAERANRLRGGLQFTPVSPEIIAAFYEHTQRAAEVSPAGEIMFSLERRKLTFMPPAAELAILPGRRVLGYFHPDDPRFLHLTDGKGAVLGTWLRKALVKANDRFALAEAMHLQAAALKAARARAVELNPEVGRLQEMRDRNQALLNASSFVDVTPAGQMDRMAFITPVASSLSAVRTAGAEMKVNPVTVPPVPDCTEELLKRATQSAPEDEHWD